MKHGTPDTQSPYPGAKCARQEIAVGAPMLGVKRAPSRLVPRATKFFRWNFKAISPELQKNNGQRRNNQQPGKKIGHEKMVADLSAATWTGLRPLPPPHVA
jgi:hypothetical protein